MIDDDQEALAVVRLQATSYPLFAGKQARIGRAADNEIVLNDPKVSRYHAVIEWNGSGFLLRDLGSTNGTFVNGAQVEGPLLLRPGDELAIGDGVFLVEAR